MKAIYGSPFCAQLLNLDSNCFFFSFLLSLFNKSNPFLSLSGVDIVFTCSFGFMNPTRAAAERHPNKKFVHVSGYTTIENMSTMFAKIYQVSLMLMDEKMVFCLFVCWCNASIYWQGRYLSGLVAGDYFKLNNIDPVVCYIAAFPIPEVKRGINAFTIGCREAHPSCIVSILGFFFFLLLLLLTHFIWSLCLRFIFFSFNLNFIL